jgi:hypothetical protein
MGDAGLEPATSALSRRNRAGRGGQQAAWMGTKWLQIERMPVPIADPWKPPIPVVVFENCSNGSTSLLGFAAPLGPARE